MGIGDERLTVDELRALVERHLRDDQNRPLYYASGAVLYCSIEAIRPFPLYIMGLNPGGAPDSCHPIIASLSQPIGKSAYLHDCWLCGTGNVCTHFQSDGAIEPRFRSRHQKHIVALLDDLGLPVERVPAINAVFARSARLSDLMKSGFGLWDWWEKCWPVHQRLLAVVRPKVIVTLGYGESTSAFGLLRHEAEGQPAGQRIPNGAGKMLDGRFDLSDGGALPARVIGIRHPSYGRADLASIALIQAAIA